MKKKPYQSSIAIVGIGCIFAKSSDLKAFLKLLTRGINAVSDPPDTHQYLTDYYDPDPKKPDHIYCHRGGFLPRIDFDPSEFGIPPAALEATDTSQLLGLLVAKQALADAGYGDGGKVFDRDKASVILGVTGTQELVIPLGARLGHPIWRQSLADNNVPESTANAVIQGISDRYVPWQENSFPGLLGNVVAGRIANRFDLGGTNCVVDAACASSMAAIHMGLLELETGRSDLVLTGGVDTINDAFMHMCFSKTQILSASGDIRPFSQDADGTVLGEGIGMVVLKRLADAERDGNRIYAVIKGLGSASDGKSQSIYAPRPEGQALALRRAYQKAGIDPASIAMVEAHGTGTRVGDQVEFKALCDVFGKAGAAANGCALGSVKSNIGHTKAAAGTAGLIKAALAIYHKVLPPTLKAQPADAKLGVEKSPFYINHSLRPWPAEKDKPRRAGVSAFGFGGSNFHAVLEEYESQKAELSWDGSVEIAAFSGSNRETVADQVQQWAATITPHSSAREIGRKSAQSRRQFQVQDAIRAVMVIAVDRPDQVVQSCQAAEKSLRSGNGEIASAAYPVFIGHGKSPGPLAFLFPGQGSQYVGMGRDLICCLPASLDVLQEAAFHFDATHPLSEYLYPRMPGDKDRYEQRLRETDVAQPAIGAVSVALLEALRWFGIAPDATCGHSYGELVALYAAGRIDRENLWKLSVARGRLMAQAGAAGAGRMLAVIAPIEELARQIDPLENVVLANRNSPNQGVLSGPAAAIEAAEALCRQKGWDTIHLPVSAAFHSPLVSAAQEPFQKAVDQVEWRSGDIMVMSNTTGDVYPEETQAAKQLLGGQLAHPVDFISNIEALYDKGVRTFIEIGPKSVLTRLTKTILKGRAFEALALDNSAGREFGLVDLARTLAHLSALGYPIQLDRWEKPAPKSRVPRMRISLSGANYRSSTPPKAPTAGLRKVAIGTDGHGSTRPSLHAGAPAIPDGPSLTTPVAPPDLKTADRQKLQSEQIIVNTQKTFLNQALAAVQQGLSSMQALQSQTTQAHQKYLETQAEANRTLQQMVQSTQALAATAMGAVPAALPPAAAMTAPRAGIAQMVAPAASPAAIVAASPVTATAQSPVAPPEETVAAASNVLDDTVRASLIQIVSRLTGYPEEMLGLEMDIEADLGIDSIKRVEILSALEEHLPHLPKVTPDRVGTLKTLGQICDYLCAHVAPASAPLPSPVAAMPATGVAPSKITQALVGIVSRLTGYPEEMLGLEMDIEADLGIDSIKRVEILSALEEHLPHLPKVTPDMVGTLKTLGQICDYLCSSHAPQSEANLSAAPGLPAMNTSFDHPIARYEVLPRLFAQSGKGRFNPARGYPIGVICQDAIWAKAIVTALTDASYDVKLLNETAELSSTVPNLAGLVMCAPMAPAEAFEWAQRSAPLLLESAGHGHALFYTVSRLDGAFGLNGGPLENPQQGALAGLTKTAAIEWPSVHCRAVDVDPQWPAASAAQALVTEITQHYDDPCVEVGLGSEGRTSLQMAITELPATTSLELSSTDVIVAAGGARGVTAAAVLALTETVRCSVALLGRSPQPQDEPAWLAPLCDEAQIKQAILQHVFKERAPSPKALEKAYRQWMSNREILRTLDAFAQQGVRARYYPLDIRNAQAVAATLAIVREELGPVKALIHGAGVLEDRLIIDKQIDQFQTVYNTKVQGLLSLIEAMREDDLRYMVLFSSISARMGNKGQADYAMANEALNKLATQESFQRPGCKVVSINWGPWDGGMVTPSLKRAFENSGVQLIPIPSGAAAMIAEMGQPPSKSVEVVIGAPLPLANTVNTGGTPKAHEPVAADVMVQAVRREIDAGRCPVLQSHCLDGRPVVPLALITEWLAHSALHANPGLVLHGIDGLRLLKGIALDQNKKVIRLMAGGIKRNGQVYEVDVEVRDGSQNGAGTVHSKAKAILADYLPAAPHFDENGHFKPTPGLPSLKDIYSRILFHGDALKGIEKIVRLSKSGMTAQIRCAPAPESWLHDPMRSRWIADPLVLDCAFQMAIIWCHEQQGLVSLPSYAHSYRQYRDRFPADGVTAVLEVVKATDRKMVADFTFLDQKKAVIACMTGYEAVMDPGLFKAFGVKAA